MFSVKKQRNYVISESDISMTLEFLKQDKMSYAASMPKRWSRTLFVQHIGEALAELSKPNLNTSFMIFDNVWGHLVPVGIDLVRYPSPANTWQIILSVRGCHTDPKKLVSINASKLV